MEDNICPICVCVLHDDYYTTKCNHIFCNECINEYMTFKYTEFI